MLEAEYEDPGIYSIQNMVVGRKGVFWGDVDSRFEEDCSWDREPSQLNKYSTSVYDERLEASLLPDSDKVLLYLGGSLENEEESQDQLLDNMQMHYLEEYVDPKFDHFFDLDVVLGPELDSSPKNISEF